MKEGGTGRKGKERRLRKKRREERGGAEERNELKLKIYGQE